MDDLDHPECEARHRRVQHHRRSVDWSAIEADYRDGALSLRALAVKHGCSHSTIANFASRHGWARRTPEVRSA